MRKAKFMSLFMAAALIVTGIPSDNLTFAKSKPVSLSKTSTTLKIKGSKKGSAKIKFKTSKGVKIKSKKFSLTKTGKKYVSVSKKGVVKAKKKGSATITITVKYTLKKKTKSIKLKYKVTVKKVASSTSTHTKAPATKKPTVSPSPTASTTEEPTPSPTQRPLPTKPGDSDSGSNIDVSTPVIVNGVDIRTNPYKVTDTMVLNQSSATQRAIPTGIPTMEEIEKRLASAKPETTDGSTMPPDLPKEGEKDPYDDPSNPYKLATENPNPTLRPPAGLTYIPWNMPKLEDITELDKVPVESAKPAPTSVPQYTGEKEEPEETEAPEEKGREESFSDSHMHQWTDWVVTKQATCTTAGSEKRECTTCSAYEIHIISAKNHEYEVESTVPNTAYTCGGQTITYRCKNCGRTYKTVEGSAHKMASDYKIVESPTCIKRGVQYRYCEICGGIDNTSKQYLDKVDHDWGDGVVKRQPTTKSYGVLEYQCKNCKETKTELIPMLATEDEPFHIHEYGEWTVQKAATCGTAGKERRSCSCGAYQIRQIPKLDHTYEKISSVDQTGYSCGGQLETYQCTQCKLTYQVVTGSSHVWGDNYKVVQKPTCSGDGFEYKFCTICGGVDRSSEHRIPAIGHKWGEGVCKRNATTTTCGIMLYTCSECGLTKTEMIERLPSHVHVWSEWERNTSVTTEAGNFVEKRYCEICGGEEQRIVDSAGNVLTMDWGAWEKISDSTCVLGGSERRSAIKNGITYYEKRIVAPLGHSFKVTAVAPTCQTRGYTEYKCERCGESYREDYVPKISHEYVVIDSQAPYCGVQGWNLYECKNCKDQYVMYTASGEHNWKAVAVQDPTCKTTGFTIYECSNCGKYYKGDFVEKVPHKYTVKQTIKPTCESWGYDILECDFCGRIYNSNKVEPLGHDWDESKTVKKEPDCINQGYSVKTCKTCGKEVLTEILPANGHKFSTTTELLQSESGSGIYVVYTCEVCGYKYADKSSYSTGGNHVHNWVKGVVVAPTCTEQGYTTYYCDVPGCTVDGKQAVMNKDYTPALGHDWKADTAKNDANPATCTTQGYNYEKCSRCGSERLNGRTPVLGHQYKEETVAATCTTTGIKKKVCEHCKDTQVIEIIPKLDHVKVKGNTISPTCQSVGYTYYTCSLCHKEFKEDYVNKLTYHNYQIVVSATKAADCLTNGSKVEECVWCKRRKETLIPKLSHDIPGSKRDICEKGGTCNRCKRSISATGHTFKYGGSGIVCETCGTSIGMSNVKFITLTSSNVNKYNDILWRTGTNAGNMVYLKINSYAFVTENGVNTLLLLKGISSGTFTTGALPNGVGSTVQDVQIPVAPITIQSSAFNLPNVKSVNTNSESVGSTRFTFKIGSDDVSMPWRYSNKMTMGNGIFASSGGTISSIEGYSAWMGGHGGWSENMTNDAISSQLKTLIGNTKSSCTIKVLGTKPKYVG